MSPAKSLFLKLLLTQQIVNSIGAERQTLQHELISVAGDPVLLKRRFRMLKQLAMYESQILDKIYNFELHNVNDYHDNLDLIQREIFFVTSRNG